MNAVWKTIRFIYSFYKLTKLSSDSRTVGLDDRKSLLEEAKVFRKVIEENGPAYIKWGQILSIRYDLFPVEVCEELQLLLDSGEAYDFKYVQDYLARHLDKESLSLIQHIEQEPIGVASLGQVNKAFLKTGEVVAIKVQKPDVYITIKKDIKVIKRMINILEVIPQLAKMNLEEFVREFEYWTYRELDYELEGQNIDQFSKDFEDDPRILAPKVFWKLTNRKVLTTEYVDGIPGKRMLRQFQRDFPNEVINVGQLAMNKNDLISIFTDMIYNQLLKFGFIHADPHPSNIIVTGNNQVTMIDFGMVMKLTKSQLAVIKEMFDSLILGDMKRMVELVVAVDLIEGVDDTELLKKKVEQILSKFDSSTVKEYSPTTFIIELAYECGQLGIQWPRYFTFFIKIFATYDGMLQLMDPQINLVQQFAPLVEADMMTSMTDKFDLKKVGKDAYSFFENIYELMNEFPDEIRDFLKEIREDGIPVRVTSEQKVEQDATPPDDDDYKMKLQYLSIMFVMLLCATLILVIVPSTSVLPIFLLAPMCAIIGVLLLYYILK